MKMDVNSQKIISDVYCMIIEGSLNLNEMFDVYLCDIICNVNLDEFKLNEIIVFDGG